jgi:hypothetical protein
MISPRFQSLVALALLLSACARDQASYPSLAERPIEKNAAAIVNEPPPAPRVLAPSNAERMARVRGFADLARNGAVRFNKALAENEAAVRRGAGAATSSESWVVAQMTLSRIEASRHPVTEALAGLDDVRREMLGSGLSEDDANVDRIVRDIEAIDAEQQAALDRLAISLRMR